MGSPTPIITLTTDFGLADGTVGAMIGVIKSICRETEVMVTAADIPPHDIPRGAWALFQTTPFFPPGAIHVAVVDPGVGSDRRAVLAVTARGLYIGPDNGVLSWAVRDAGLVRWLGVENPAYRIARRGVTFDGRDLFAPAAAYLARGIDPGVFGPEIENPVHLDWPQPVESDAMIMGEVLVTDTFGNLITNIPAPMATEMFGAGAPLIAGLPNGQVARSVRSYLDIAGELGVVINGANLLEIAARGRSAAEATGARRGDRVVVTAGERMP